MNKRKKAKEPESEKKLANRRGMALMVAALAVAAIIVFGILGNQKEDIELSETSSEVQLPDSQAHEEALETHVKEEKRPRSIQYKRKDRRDVLYVTINFENGELEFQSSLAGNMTNAKYVEFSGEYPETLTAAYTGEKQEDLTIQFVGTDADPSSKIELTRLAENGKSYTYEYLRESIEFFDAE